MGNGDAIDVNIKNDGTLIVITTVKGKVELRKENGTLISTIGYGDAVGANFSGDDILIKTKKGKIEIRKPNGVLIKTI